MTYPKDHLLPLVKGFTSAGTEHLNLLLRKEHYNQQQAGSTGSKGSKTALAASTSVSSSKTGKTVTEEVCRLGAQDLQFLVTYISAGKRTVSAKAFKEFYTVGGVGWGGVGFTHPS